MATLTASVPISPEPAERQLKSRRKPCRIGIAIPTACIQAKFRLLLRESEAYGRSPPEPQEIEVRIVGTRKLMHAAAQEASCRSHASARAEAQFAVKGVIAPGKSRQPGLKQLPCVHIRLGPLTTPRIPVVPLLRQSRERARPVSS